MANPNCHLWNPFSARDWTQSWFC